MKHKYEAAKEPIAKHITIARYNGKEYFANETGVFEGLEVKAGESFEIDNWVLINGNNKKIVTRSFAPKNANLKDVRIDYV